MHIMGWHTRNPFMPVVIIEPELKTDLFEVY